jgi:DNA polymerase-3 subunit delta'
MSFKNIIGHNRSIKILKNAVERGRIPSAYLFSGIDGIGKKSLALTLAKVLNCKNETLDSCDECISCQKIDSYNHPDVRVIKPEGNVIKIGQIRDLQKGLSYRPFEGKKKVSIIDEAEKMNQHSANSLLKTLEEPPLDTLIILVTSHGHRLLPTITSRCQKIRFNPLPSDSISQIVRNHLDIDEERAHLLASLSGGSASNALRMNREVFLRYRKKLIHQISTVSHNSINELFQFAGELSSQKDDLLDILESLKIYFRDLLVMKEGLSKKGLINVDLEKELNARASNFNSKDLLGKIKIVDETQQMLMGNVNKRLALETMLLRLPNA